jgi:hypothetical protein
MDKPQETRKVPMSERALLARINRRLVKDGQKMKLCPPDSRWYNDLGRYYVIDVSINGITAKDCDLEGWGRDLGCLKPYEELSQ